MVVRFPPTPAELIDRLDALIRRIEDLIRHPLLVKVIEAPPVTPTLDLNQLYLAIRIEDPEADKPFILEETLAPGFSGWLGPIPLSPRICIQRQVMLWGDPTVRITFAIDSIDRTVGPFHLPPAPGIFEFVGYFEKSIIYIRRENLDRINPAESHIVAFAVMPLASEWERFWKKRIGTQVKALKGIFFET